MALKTKNGSSQEVSGKGFEHIHVQEVYNEIAPHVNNIPHKAWPNVKRFLNKFGSGSLVADIGCGNGRYLNINKNIYKLGLDKCRPLVDNSRTKGHEVLYADNLQVPFRSDVFDGVISIGVVHHFCSLERRIQAMKELARVLSPGGQLMVYVWAFEQKHRKFDSQDVLVPWHGGAENRTKPGSSSRLSSFDRSFSSASSVSEDDSSESADQLDVGQPVERKTPTLTKKLTYNSTDSLHKLKEIRKQPSGLDLCKHCRSRSVASEKSELVKECRKLEASLRALSMDCICNGQTNGSNENTGHKQCLCKVQSLDSLQSKCDLRHLKGNMKQLKDAGLVGEESQSNTASKTRRALGFETSKQLDVIEDDLTGDDNVFENSDPSDNREVTIDHHPCGESGNSRQKNAKNGLETYRQEQQNISDQQENDQDRDKPEKQSFFKSIKTKFLRIFDSDSDDEMTEDSRASSRKTVLKKRKSDPRQNFKQPFFDTSHMPPSDPDLDFAVREFPLSSWPAYLDKKNQKVLQKGMTSDDFHGCKKDDHYQRPPQKLNGRDQNLDSSVVTVTSRSQSFTKSPNHKFHDHRKHSPLSDKQTCQNALENTSCCSKLLNDRDNYGALDAHQNEKGSDSCLYNKQQIFSNDDNQAKRFVMNGISNDHRNKDISVKKIETDVLHNHQPVLNRKRSEMSRTLDQKLPSAGTCSCKRENGVNKEVGGSSLQMDAVPQVSCVDTGIAKNATDTRLSRYYHVFREDELQDLILTHVKELKIVQCFYDHANWCVIAEKI